MGRWSYWTSDDYETKHGVVLTITDRRGERFAGRFDIVTEDGEFATQVEGSCRDESIQWRNVKQLQGEPIGSVLDRARVEGLLKGDTMTLHYTDPDVALMELKRVESP